MSFSLSPLLDKMTMMTAGYSYAFVEVLLRMSSSSLSSPQAQAVSMRLLLRHYSQGEEILLTIPRVSKSHWHFLDREILELPSL